MADGDPPATAWTPPREGAASSVPSSLGKPAEVGPQRRRKHRRNRSDSRMKWWTIVLLLLGASGLAVGLVLGLVRLLGGLRF